MVGGPRRDSEKKNFERWDDREVETMVPPELGTGGMAIPALDVYNWTLAAHNAHTCPARTEEDGCVPSVGSWCNVTDFVGTPASGPA